ncbi:MAG: SUMF1/EgtB/PvdO family nonheme iron enzyme [Phycisphaerales bacterium]
MPRSPAIHAIVPALAVMFAPPCPSPIGPHAAAGPIPPDYGFQWATITHPGNAPYVQDRGPELPPLLYGGVNSTFRISKTEVAAREWLEFANAFVSQGDPFEIGQQVDSTTLQTVYGPGAVPVRFLLIPGQATERIAVSEVSWFNAARYCNWLHNNKERTVAALEYGAYDLRGFNDGIAEDHAGPQPRLAGAKFFLPNKDEWVKAVHFDPNRNGSDQPGYWQYPYSSDTAPVVGAPGVGQTNTGLDFSAGQLAFRVGAYPDAVTPWGLLDASGGVSEWLEGRRPFDSKASWDGSSWSASFGPASTDRIELGGGQSISGSSFLGFRIASIVPAPAAMVLCILGFSLVVQERRR